MIVNQYTVQSSLLSSIAAFKAKPATLRLSWAYSDTEVIMEIFAPPRMKRECLDTAFVR